MTLEKNRHDMLPERALPIRTESKNDVYNVHADLDLREAIRALAAQLPGLKAVRLFGSRRFGSGSARSDIDLLLVGEGLPTGSAVAAIAREIDSYLDTFTVFDGVAQSAVNESTITAPTQKKLFRMLHAIEVWTVADDWIGDERFVQHRLLAGYNPPYTRAALAGAEPLIAKRDILFVSALPIEHSAIMAQLDVAVSALPRRHASYQMGEIRVNGGSRLVAACVADRAGPIPAALTVARGIEMFRPRLVVLTGITAGIAGRAQLGDLIVPDTVVEYEATKITDDAELTDGRQHALHPTTLASIRSWTSIEDWLASLSEGRPDLGRCRLLWGAMASGSKVVASSDRAMSIAALSRKTVAIEMEALGVVEACQRAEPLVPAIVIKAVSDLADAAKNDDWHSFAAGAAANLAAALVRESLL